MASSLACLHASACHFTQESKAPLPLTSLLEVLETRHSSFDVSLESDVSAQQHGHRPYYTNYFHGRSITFMKQRKSAELGGGKKPLTIDNVHVAL